MTDKDQTQIAGALKTALISPNEPDRAGEPSNIVDGLFAIARAIDGLTAAVQKAAGAHYEDERN
jgi:hypothetical protein